MLYESKNPTTEESLRIYPIATQDEMEQTLDAGVEAFNDWKKRSFAERATYFNRLADLLESHAVELGIQMAQEMGKPKAEGEGEAKKCAWVCRYYAEHAESFLQDVPHQSDGSEAYVRFDPIGNVLGVMPWNFPYWQVLRYAAPTLMAGNVTILKHAPNSPEAAERITALFLEAGFPKGVFQNLRLSNEQAAEVIQDSRIAGVTLTGSTGAGQAVAALGGKVLKPMVMELGGSDPLIIFPDADLEQAVTKGMFSRCLNNGQSCIAAKRFLVHESILDDFLLKSRNYMAGLKVGDPMEDSTQIGPLARKDLQEQLNNQVERSLEAGANLFYQGEAPTIGFFYPPSILTDVKPENPAAHEEFFGPVAIVIPFSSEEEMLAIANSTNFGLGASVWTQNKERIQRLVPDIEAGNVFVNGFVKSDPRIPFGGIKMSGFGRELGRDGILAFVNAKTVWIG